VKALVIVGHGSHLNAYSSDPVYRHAETIRSRGLFDEVRECFWKEEPSMRQILHLIESDEVFVVPLFISEGYFTEEVIPRELGLGGTLPGSVGEAHGKRVHYCEPIGTHPGMTRMILRRAEEAAALSPEEARQAGLIVIGHGTERNSNSAEVIYRVTEEAAATGEFGRVATGFLDQEPQVDAVLRSMQMERIVLVPFFVAEGWHTEETIPDDLGISRPADSRISRLRGRTIYYSAPVGTFPEVADIVVERAREAGATLPQAAEAAPV